MYYAFLLKYVDRNRILEREKKFRATDDEQAKTIGKNKWMGAGKTKRVGKLVKVCRSGQKTEIASWVSVSY